jgi:hypothetical protein
MRVRLLTGVVAAAALALTGCGTSSESGYPLAAKPAQKNTSESETPKVEVKKPEQQGGLDDIDRCEGFVLAGGTSGVP